MNLEHFPHPVLPSVKNGTPALILAPMEGVTDAPMRAILTERGGFSFCVSEFLRISQEVLPVRCFIEHVPELKKGCVTPVGTPVQLQLLGGDAEKLAQSALRAVESGARGIDLNFGCPAPTVNRHDGGATLLKYPLRLRAIVEAVRKAVPSELPVSAKLRLGFDSMDSIHENAERAAEGGAAWITIHGRTKTQGYMPPAYWGPIGEVKRRLGIPVVANGDIWTLDDFRRCRDQTGSEHFMIGRGALADPLLAIGIARELGLPVSSRSPQAEPEKGDAFGKSAREWLPLLERFAEIMKPFTLEAHPNYTTCRIKQWLRLANRTGELSWFEPVKRAQSLDQVFSVMRGEAV